MHCFVSKPQAKIRRGQRHHVGAMFSDSVMSGPIQNAVIIKLDFEIDIDENYPVSMPLTNTIIYLLLNVPSLRSICSVSELKGILI